MEKETIQELVEDASNGSKYSVPNLERALQILELLAKHPNGLSITELSNMLSIPKNSTFRITATLLDFGYLNRDEGSKAFALSGKLLSLGYSAIGKQGLQEKALDIMLSLRDETKETVLLGTILNHEGIVLELIPGLHSIKFWVDVGTRFMMHTAAPSKAMLAFMPEAMQQKITEKIKFDHFTDHTISSLPEFTKILNEVKKNGYAVDNGEEIDKVNCVSAPVFDRHGFPVAAIWITGPADRIPASTFPQIGNTVKSHAARISQRMGYYQKS